MENARFMSVGTLADVREACGTGAALLDMKGAAVLPGLIDSHAHLMYMGFKLLRPQLDNCTSANGSSTAALAAYARAHEHEQLSVDAMLPEEDEAAEAQAEELDAARLVGGESVVENLRRYVAAHPLEPGTWLQGFGWDQNKWGPGAVAARGDTQDEGFLSPRYHKNV